MNLYEFIFIAQQGLLQQEVEGMVQEFAVSLQNIKAEIIFQEIKRFVEKGDSKLTSQEVETCSRKIQKDLIFYSDVLEKFVKSLWTELKEDLSNLKEVKAKVDKELQNTLKEFSVIKKLLDLPAGEKQPTKDMLIRVTVTALKKSISEHMLKHLQKDFENQSSEMVEKLLKNIEASGLIKYEHWGLLDFAYPINKMKSGHYCLLCVSSTPNIMDEFIRRVKLNENVIRYLSVQVDKIFEGKSYMMNKQIEEQSV